MSKKTVGITVAVMLMTGNSYADPIQVGCQFYDEEANLVGDGKYTYDPSVSDTFSYVIAPNEEKTFETNYATEFYPNITLNAGSGWTGGDYQLTHSIIDIWGGDDPGTLYAAGGGSPFSSILSGWQMLEPKRCSGCSVVSLSMDWDSLSGGSWWGGQRHQNSIDPTTGEIENHSANGNFTCENMADFEVYPDKMGVEAAVSTFVAFNGYDGPELQYTWTQTEGPLATTVVEENTQVLRVTVPDLDADTILKFTVSAGGVTKDITLPVLNRVDSIAGGGPTTLYCDLTTEAGVPGGAAQFSFDSSVVDVIVKGNMNRPIVIPMVDELFSTPGKLTDWVMNPVWITQDGSTFAPEIRLEGGIIQWYHAGNPQPGQIVKYGSNNADFRYDGEWMPYYSRYDRVTRSYLMSFDSGSLSWSEASGTYSVYDSTAGSIDGTFNCLSNPGTDNPGTDNPGTDNPGTDNPGTDNPGTDNPGTDNPGTDNPGTDSPGTDSPGTDNPGTDNPGTDNPGTDNPGTDNPGTDNPGTDSPGTDSPGTDSPGTDSPGTDSPGTDNPGTDNPGTDNPGTDNPGTDNPGTDNPGTDNPGTDNPGTDNPGTDSPGTDSPGTDSPGTDNPEVVLSDQGSSGSGAFGYLLVMLVGSLKIIRRSRNGNLME